MTQVFLLFQLTLLVFFNVDVKAEFTEVVDTDKGRVRGNILETVQLKQRYSAFRGIPYAEPPVGCGRRFRRPVPAKPWNTTLYAINDPNNCAQWDFAWKASDRHIGSEDCLYLNVYTPELNFTHPRPRAVMAYIHGGAFIFGTIHSSRLGPDFLIEKDVVVVAMNYRLGVFGFLAIPSDIVDANNGLKDQAEALRWIQRNIRKFGGDPDKVTIFGESAGAASVEHHKLSPQSQNLFRASIAMSGSALNEWAYLDKSEANLLGMQFIGMHLNDFSIDDNCLYSKMVNFDMHPMLTSEYLQWLLTNKMPSRPTNEFPFRFSDRDTDIFMPDKPLKTYEYERFIPKPHMLGFMKDEGVSIAAPISALTDFLCSSIASSISSTVTNHYFIEGIDLTQRILTLTDDAPIYYYQNSFDYDQALHKVGAMRTKSGAGHGDDIAHVFWVSNQEQPLDPNSDIGRHREKMVTMWTNFAKYLTPTLDDAWKKSNQTGGYLDINKCLVFRPNSRPVNNDIDVKNRVATAEHVRQRDKWRSYLKST